MNITAELINGLCLGIEHITITNDDEEQEDDEYIYPKYAVVINLFIFRLMFIKF